MAAQAPLSTYSGFPDTAPPRPASTAEKGTPVPSNPQDAAKSLPSNLARAVQKAARPKPTA